jgi:alkanesulfonate monooxygenase SsuD/methylene tetrahydromethanopterin reductase-like flavin-dependent oxidoreductase (luciferase family)
MRVGVYFDMRDARDGSSTADQYARTLDVCVLAEELGAGSVWLSEHHGFADGYLPQPLVLAAAIAAKTATLRVGTAVLLAPLRPAALIAEEAAIVDQISAGRLDLGLGAGYRPAEFRLYDSDPERPLDQLFRRVAEIRGLLADRAVTPGTAQQPLPIWLGCNGPVGAYRAGRTGEGLLSVRRKLLPEYLRGRADAGRPEDGGRMSGPVNVFLTDEPERDAPVVALAYARMRDNYAREAGHQPADAGSTDPASLLERGLAGGQSGLLVARPDDAAREITRYFAGLPVDTIFTWSHVPGVPAELSDRHLELWCGLEDQINVSPGGS